MPTGYSRSPKILKGALVVLNKGFIGPVPNVIIFQYNPEKLSRVLMSSLSSKKGKSEAKNEEKRDEHFDPSERFSLDLLLDVIDTMEETDKTPVSVIFGMADMISAIEMLLYPKSEALFRKKFSTAV